MEVSVKTLREGEGFKPYTVSIVIESKEESIYFHDNAMTVLSPLEVSPIYGAIYKAGMGDVVDIKGVL